MPPRPDLHPGEVETIDLMRRMQETVAETARFEGSIDTPIADLTAGGVDQAFPHAECIVSAAVAERDGSVLDDSIVTQKPAIGYVPGFLAFREGPAAIAAIGGLAPTLDVLMVDGNGRIHPRQAGLATHLGVVLDIPTVGVAKSLLCGRPIEPIDDLDTGEIVPIYADESVDTDSETIIGYAVQTRQYDATDRHINPLFVSPGHDLGAMAAAELTLALSDRYKLPSPIRQADRLATDQAAMQRPKG